MQIGLSIYKKQDLKEYQNLPWTTNGLPYTNLNKENPIEYNLRKSLLQQSFAQQENQIKIKSLKSLFLEETNEYKFKIVVISLGQPIKITKTRQDFIEFEKQFNQFIEQNPHYIELLKTYPLQIETSLQNQWPGDILKDILRNIVKSIEFYERFVFDFLQIPELQREEYSLIRDSIQQQEQDYFISDNIEISPEPNLQKRQHKGSNKSNNSQSPKKKKKSKEIKAKKTDDSQYKDTELMISTVKSNDQMENRRKSQSHNELSMSSEGDISEEDYEQQNNQKGSNNLQVPKQIMKKKKKKQVSFIENQQYKAFDKENQNTDNKSMMIPGFKVRKFKNTSDQRVDKQLLNSSDSIIENENQKVKSLYFDVAVTEIIQNQDHLEFLILINYTEYPQNKWKLKKRYTEFEALQQTLKKTLKCLLPKLPGKLILMEQQELKNRQQQLEKYLDSLLNDEIYICKPLFDFIKVDKPQQNFILKTIFQEEQLNNYSAASKGHECKFNENQDSYTAYTFQILRDGQPLKTIQKRYKEFDELNESITIRYKNLKQLNPENIYFNTVKLPQLPPKISYFQQIKTSASYREKQLEDYLNKIFQLKDVGKSYQLIKFLDLQPKVNSNMLQSGTSNNTTIDGQQRKLQKSKKKSIQQNQFDFAQFDNNNQNLVQNKQNDIIETQISREHLDSKDFKSSQDFDSNIINSMTIDNLDKKLKVSVQNGDLNDYDYYFKNNKQSNDSNILI